MPYADILYCRTRQAGYRFLACPQDLSKAMRDTIKNVQSRLSGKEGWLVRADAEHVFIAMKSRTSKLFGLSYQGINTDRIDGRAGYAMAGLAIRRSDFTHFPTGSFASNPPDYLTRMGDYVVKHIDDSSHGDITKVAYDRHLPAADNLAPELQAIAHRIRSGEHFECVAHLNGKVTFHGMSEVERAAADAADDAAREARQAREQAVKTADEAERARFHRSLESSFLDRHWGKCLSGAAVLAAAVVLATLYHHVKKPAPAPSPDEATKQQHRR